MSVRDVNMPEPNEISSLKGKANPMSEIEKTAKDIEAVDRVTEKASKLSGADKLAEQLEKAQNKVEKTQAEFAAERHETLQREILKSQEQIKGLEDKIASTTPKDSERLTRLEHDLQEARDASHKLEIQHLESKYAELKDTQTKGSDIGSRIQQAKEDAKALGMTEEKTGGVPPEITVQLQKMNNDLAIQIEQMKDDRDRRDKEWQLTLRKWEDEKLMRQQELDAKMTMDREKLDTIKTLGTRFGGALLEGAMEGSEGTPAIASNPSITSKKYIIDAGEGEDGEFNCPKCNSIVGIALDTITAICANCGMNFPIRRVAPKGKIPVAEGKAESKQAEGEQVGQAENPESDSEYSGASA